MKASLQRLEHVRTEYCAGSKRSWRLLSVSGKRSVIRGGASG